MHVINYGEVNGVDYCLPIIGMCNRSFVCFFFQPKQMVYFTEEIMP